jgi:hypothetical protein
VFNDTWSCNDGVCQYVERGFCLEVAEQETSVVVVDEEYSADD